MVETELGSWRRTHYSKQLDDNPSSRAIFEKKLRSISATIKDEYIKKYI